ncbi:hypothetical protein ACV36C_37480, partial [Pseudomonas aeruginosa]
VEQVLAEAAALGQGQKLAKDPALRQDTIDTVLGAEVAAAVHSRHGAKPVLPPRLSTPSHVNHDDKLFTVAGNLQRT